MLGPKAWVGLSQVAKEESIPSRELNRKRDIKGGNLQRIFRELFFSSLGTQVTYKEPTRR